MLCGLTDWTGTFPVPLTRFTCSGKPFPLMDMAREKTCVRFSPTATCGDKYVPADDAGVACKAAETEPNAMTARTVADRQWDMRAISSNPGIREESVQAG